MVWTKSSTCGQWYQIRCDTCGKYCLELHSNKFDAELRCGLHCSIRGRDSCPSCTYTHIKRDRSEARVKHLMELWTATAPATELFDGALPPRVDVGVLVEPTTAQLLGTAPWQPAQQLAGAHLRHHVAQR